MIIFWDISLLINHWLINHGLTLYTITNYPPSNQRFLGNCQALQSNLQVNIPSKALAVKEVMFPNTILQRRQNKGLTTCMKKIENGHITMGGLQRRPWREIFDMWKQQCFCPWRRLTPPNHQCARRRAEAKQHVLERMEPVILSARYQ